VCRVVRSFTMDIDHEYTAYGNCTIYTLDAAHEMENLGDTLKAIVPARMLTVLDGFPGSMILLAENVTIPKFSEWLRSTTESQPSIVIYEPAERFGPDAYLTLDFGPAGSKYPWTVWLDFQTGLPEHCPRPLAEVYRTVGGISHWYGESSSVISPGDVQQLTSLFPDYENLCLFDPESDIDPHDWRPWYECDGDYLCYHADGTSRWLGVNEHTPPAGAMSTHRCVTDLFAALLAKRRFNGSAQRNRS
jgi:hypothetical protein